MTVTSGAVGNQKSVTPTEATIGQRVTYRVSVTIPANVNFYDAVVRDRLPAGIDASTVQPEGFTCFVGTVPCGITGTYLPPAPQPDGTTLIGWYAGNVLASPDPRLVTYHLLG